MDFVDKHDKFVKKLVVAVLTADKEGFFDAFKQSSAQKAGVFGVIGEVLRAKNIRILVFSVELALVLPVKEILILALVLPVDLALL